MSGDNWCAGGCTRMWSGKEEESKMWSTVVSKVVIKNTQINMQIVELIL